MHFCMSFLILFFLGIKQLSNNLAWYNLPEKLIVFLCDFIKF